MPVLSCPRSFGLKYKAISGQNNRGDKSQNLDRGGFTNGDLTSLAPPGRPAHRFTYTPLNFTEDYIAPNVGVGTTTNYLYNLDKQLIRVTRPDAQMLNLNYDTAGRLSTMTFPRGTLTYNYNAATGNLSGITAPGGVGLSFDYDGALPLSAAWSGPVTFVRLFDNLRVGVVPRINA
ncbi:MAG: hypothetical protein HZC18_08215 [Candidatus Omnitrophica bacterium]|nr:hypothetical protein [Candidatus Omnitrophota bacterium]